MKKIVFFLLMITGFFACKNEQGGQKGELDVTTASIEEEHLELSQEQMQKIGLVVGKMDQRNMQSVVRMNGRLETPPENRAAVSAILPGVIQQVFVKQGQLVKKGQKLASLRNPNFIEWQQTYLESKAKLEFFEKELKRQTQLAAQDISAQKQLESTTSEYKIINATLAGLKAKLQLAGLPAPEEVNSSFTSDLLVVSPINGFIEDMHLSLGQYVESNMPLMVIVNNDHLHGDLLAFEKDLPYLMEGQQMELFVQARPKDKHMATIFSITRAVDEQANAVHIHAELNKPNPNLYSGMYVEARVSIQENFENCLPEEAIAQDKSLSYIFVVEEKHKDGSVHFKKVQVIQGINDGGFTAITALQDLSPDAEIVVEGAFFLMAQSKKEEGGGGHEH